MAISKFGQAFQAARKAGKKEFSFNGKKYHTKTKEEMAPKKQAPIPKQRPAPKKKAPVNVRVPKGPTISPVGSMPSKKDMEKATNVKMKDRRFLRGTFMTGKDRK